jgi:hypothetical protein
MSNKTHWKKNFNYEYLGSFSLPDGKDLVLTIKAVAVEQVTGNQGKKEDCCVVRFDGDHLPMILNRTNAKTIEKVHGTPFIEEWVGKSIQLYVAKGIKAFGDTVDALRIRDFAPQPTNIDPTEAIAALKEAGDLETLKTIYQSLSKDLQGHKEVAAMKNQLKEFLS